MEDISAIAARRGANPHHSSINISLRIKAPSLSPSLSVTSLPSPPPPYSPIKGKMQQNYMLPDDPLSLDRIRSVLIRLEDTIIFSLIERSQFALNPKIYVRGAFQELKDAGFCGSWLEWFLKETETFHARARRYTSPDEYPFTSPLPPPLLPPLAFPKILHPNKINVNASILSFYTHAIVPRLTQQSTLALAAAKRAQGIIGDGEYEDDGNYGSAATVDVEVLQAISKRVHYGKFVSESKFLSKPSAFIPHILKRNRTALEALITKPEIEKALLRRLQKKASTYGREVVCDTPATAAKPSPAPNSSSTKSDAAPPYDDKSQWKIDVDGVKELYEMYIIPLTKEVEVDYLLQRLDGLTDEEIDELSKR